MLACVVDKPICVFRVYGNMCDREEHCEPCEPQCVGCKKALPRLSTHYCETYPVPHTWWRNGHCPLASHLPTDTEIVKKINPIKLARLRRRQGM